MIECVLKSINIFKNVLIGFWWRRLCNMLTESTFNEHVRNFTMPVPTIVDAVSVLSGYKDVRADHTDTKWAVFKHSENVIKLSGSGTDFESFKEQFDETERCYGYIRIQTGDEMSKRAKFMLVIWLGPSVGVIERAKMTNDKSLIKQYITNYALEVQLENLQDVDEKVFKTKLTQIGGTLYGTGDKRD